jgi:hypothetical protein
VADRIRVQPPGPAWGIAGYSEGGYCAANLALRHPLRYGFAGVMSGYFQPTFNRIQYGNTVRHVDPFGRSAALRKQNSPLDMLHQLPAGSHIPHFWVGAARAVRGDVLNALSFVALLRKQQPATPLMISQNGAHNAVAWRSMILPMLEWMTPRLAQAAAAQGCQGCVAPGTAASAPAAAASASAPAASASAPAIPSPSPRLNRPLPRPSQDRTRAHAQRSVDARRPAALGAGRLPDTALRAIG